MTTWKRMQSKLHCKLCDSTLKLPEEFAVEYTLEEFARYFTSWINNDFGWKCSACKLEPLDDFRPA